MLAKFLGDQKSITMSSINCLKYKFLKSKIMHKKKIIYHIVNNIRLVQNLTCVLRV